MERQNVTLALPQELLRKAKRIAVERQTSLSGFMTQLLADAVNHEDSYEQARKRNLARLRRGFHLGLNGVVPWSREELHDR